MIKNWQPSHSPVCPFTPKASGGMWSASCCQKGLFASEGNTLCPALIKDLRGPLSVPPCVGWNPFVVLISSLCSVLDRVRAGPRAPRCETVHVCAHGKIRFHTGPDPELCGTNSLCNMSGDKLAGNYWRRRSLLSRRGRGASPLRGTLNHSRRHFFFSPTVKLQTMAFKKNKQVSPNWNFNAALCFIFGRASCISQPRDCGCDCCDWIPERGSHRRTVAGCGFRWHQTERRGKKKKKRHIFVCDKHDSVPFFLFHENWWIKIFLLQELSADALEKHIRQKESSFCTLDSTKYSHSAQTTSIVVNVLMFSASSDTF